jgi:acyl-CoA thioester hydrolase
MSPRKRVEKPLDGDQVKAPTAAPATPASTLLFAAALDVRWRDLDAFNHVNNATYLTYLEEARLQWLRHVPGPWFDEHSMPVLAASEVNYRLPIEWPAQLRVELACVRLGNSSITLAHRIVDANDEQRLYSDGQVVLVWMDPTSGKSVALPQAIRDSVQAPA